MLAMGLKCHRTSLSEELNGGSRERPSQAADLGFKILSKMAKKCHFLGSLRV